MTWQCYITSYGQVQSILYMTTFFAIQALETPTQHVVHTFISTFWLSACTKCRHCRAIRLSKLQS